jgi:hypothetical protein
MSNLVSAPFKVAAIIRNSSVPKNHDNVKVAVALLAECHPKKIVSSSPDRHSEWFTGSLPEPHHPTAT